MVEVKWSLKVNINLFAIKMYIGEVKPRLIMARRWVIVGEATFIWQGR